jgi:hypothetical protein
MTTPDPSGADPSDSPTWLPQWASQLISLYESTANNQFILYGNVYDRFALGGELRGLDEFVRSALLPQFDVVLTYDLGNGIRVVSGESILAAWPSRPAKLPKQPRAAIELLTHFFRYAANLARLGKRSLQVGCIVQAGNLVVPSVSGGVDHDLGAMALLLRDWSRDDLLRESRLATFVVTENLNDLHPLLVQNPRAAHLEIPMPSAADLECAFETLAQRHPVALSRYATDLERPAERLAGTTLSAVESLLKSREHQQKPLDDAALAELKRDLVERDCNGLIEFVEPDRSLSDYAGQPAVVEWLRNDIALWRRGELQAMPMGYLLCGPVGTGKTFLVECLAGEAAVPVVKLRNFRDKWVGSTESNLERIFRLLHALGRCYVFVDEADQTLGRRSAGSGDSGVGGRVYSMLADEMSDTRNRGRIVWILASSRPDLIEVDLKRPGRIDVKLPLFPSQSPQEGLALIRALAGSRGLSIAKADEAALLPLVPTNLTPGAAEALVVKVFRETRARDAGVLDAFETCLRDYRHPVPSDVMAFQIDLAAREASDLGFVPEAYRSDR